MKKLQRFVNAFFELADEKPIAKISIEELCNRVGVKRQTFYYYFDSMGDFIHAVLEDFVEHRADKEGGFSSDVRFVADIYSKYVGSIRNILVSPYALDVTNFLHSYLYLRSNNRIAINPKYKNLPSQQIASVSRIVASILVTEFSFWVQSNLQEDKEHLIHRFEVMLKNIEKMMVENALHDSINKPIKPDDTSEKTDKH